MRSSAIEEKKELNQHGVHYPSPPLEYNDYDVNIFSMLHRIGLDRVGHVRPCKYDAPQIVTS